MMKGRLFLFTFIVIASIFGQDDNVKEQSRLSVGLEFRPNLNYRWLNKTESEADFRVLRNTNEAARLGFGTGAKIQYKLTDKFSVQAGLSFASRRFRTKEQTLNWSGVVVPLGTPSATYLSYHYNYFDIPIIVNYHFNPIKKWTFMFGVGVTTSFLLSYQQTIHTRTEGEQWRKNTDNEGAAGNDLINTFSMAMIGFNYQFAPRFSFAAHLVGEHALKATNANLLTKNYLFGGGANLSLWFQLGGNN